MNDTEPSNPKMRRYTVNLTGFEIGLLADAMQNDADMMRREDDGLADFMEARSAQLRRIVR